MYPIKRKRKSLISIIYNEEKNMGGREITNNFPKESTITSPILLFIIVSK
jgi:hypothetical protein